MPAHMTCLFHTCFHITISSHFILDGASQAEPMEMEYVEQENIPAFIPWYLKNKFLSYNFELTALKLIIFIG